MDNITISSEQSKSLGEWTFAEPGEYIVVFKAEAAQENGICVRNMTLTPVVTEENAAAEVDGAYFLSLKDAFAHQVETGAEAVVLKSDAAALDLVMPSNAVLDLNGHTLTADSVLTYASSAIIDSSENDTGVLKLLDADGNMISEENAQLPIYDAKAEGYRFFEISVEAVAISGKTSGNPKYWFKINVVNFEEVYKLIQAGSKLDIGVKMAWNGGEAEAVASAEFLNVWAEKYAASGNNFYITVSAVNTDGYDAFSLIPCMMANGVAICGDEM